MSDALGSSRLSTAGGDSTILGPRSLSFRPGFPSPLDSRSPGTDPGMTSVDPTPGLAQDVLIVGVSARAAASSALRAGLRPCCADYFADRDLIAACPAARVEPSRGFDGLAEIAERLPPSPWFYTGGLENHPALVERISARHRLWGVGADGLRRVRDPMAVAEALHSAGIAVPEVTLDPSGLPRDGTWLVKPRASGGGIGVVPLIGPVDDEPGSRYYQRRIRGRSFSALFIGATGRARLVGVVRQWVGGIPGRPFAYRGGIGPYPIVEVLSDRLRAIGDRLASVFGLVGWFGVDFVICDGIPWPVEVNPRYTASIELYERATGRPLLPDHRDACEGRTAPEIDFPPIDRPRRPRMAAKWILYAPRRMVVPPLDHVDETTEDPDAVAADIPAPGTCIETGEPILTLLASDSHEESCQSHLRRLRRSWSAWLGLLTSDEGPKTREQE